MISPLARTASVCALIAIVPAMLVAQKPSPRPPGVTDQTIAQGRELYAGIGRCNTCHGDNGGGTDDGPALTTGSWKLGDGSYQWLVHMSRHAGWGARGPQDDPRPMRGPTVLDSAQVARVAAYVWSVSRDKTPAAPRRDRD